MLATVLRSNRKQLDRLAAAWLNDGAASLELWTVDRRLEQWSLDLDAPLATLCAPIVSRERLLGELRVYGPTGEVAQARLVADAALIARLADLEEELDSLGAALGETQDQLMALFELSRSTTRQLDPQRLLEHLAPQVALITGAVGAFAVIAPEAAGHAGQWCVVQEPVALPTSQITYLFRKLQKRASEWLLDYAEAAGNDSVALVAAHLFLAPLPLRERPGFVAALGLWFAQPAAALSPYLKLARSVAEQAGAALEVALLHQEIVTQARLQTELELAREVQSRLLPQHTPRLSSLDLFAQSQPALQVGGDFYDFVSAAGAAFTFVLGDVSGKGMPAALLMAMTRTTLRRAAHLVTSNELSPAEILTVATEEMYDDFTGVGMMVTLFIGCYDPERCTLRFANAGHAPIIFCPKGGPAQLLEADGPALGVLPVCLSEDQVIPFGPGDVLIAATDGFNETHNAQGEQFGLARLLQLVEEAAGGAAQAIGQSLFAAIRDFAGAHPQFDDQTLVVLKGVSTHHETK